MRRLASCGLLLILGLLLTTAGGAAASPWSTPQRLGLSLDAGMSYDPGNEIRFQLLSLSALYDYGALWGHRAPAALHFKVHGELGVAETGGDTRSVAAAGVMARYDLGRFGGPSWLPFVEAGIGLIYTDFQVHDQGLRINFNPRLGAGCDFGLRRSWFAAAHGQHLSSGGLHHPNRGINSVFVELGRYF